MSVSARNGIHQKSAQHTIFSKPSFEATVTESLSLTSFRGGKSLTPVKYFWPQLIGGMLTAACYNSELELQLAPRAAGAGAAARLPLLLDRVSTIRIDFSYIEWLCYPSI